MTDEPKLPTWTQMLVHTTRRPIRHLIAFDPGETTGYAVFIDGRLVWSEQLKTPNIIAGTAILDGLIRNGHRRGSPIEVVIETYQIYKWRMKEHVGDTLHTARLIGCIETLCALNMVPLTKQLAQNAKKFVTDEKLKAWDMYVKGKPHARDAIRHGIFFTLFNKGFPKA